MFVEYSEMDEKRRQKSIFCLKIFAYLFLLELRHLSFTVPTITEPVNPIGAGVFYETFKLIF